MQVAMKIDMHETMALIGAMDEFIMNEKKDRGVTPDYITMLKDLREKLHNARRALND